MFEYTIKATNGQARVGEFTTPHGVIKTPVFMPVGTHGAVKSASPLELETVSSQIILANTYHLYLRPGEGLVQSLGGLHDFIQWKGPILTDSGGFQVFSLGERGMKGTVRQALRKVSEEGITFQSHLDGSRHLFTPEKSLEVQQALGADIIMAFDQPVYGLSDEQAAAEAMRRSMRWLKRSKEQWLKGKNGKQALFGIVQGGIHSNLHRESTEAVVAEDLPGNAIGGLSVGEGKPAMWQAVESIVSLLPSEKPRYFMGLGDPYDLIEATARGVDMYDCVAPSRLARHGVIWVAEGDEQSVEAFYRGDTEGLLKAGTEGKKIAFKRLNLQNAQYKDDGRAIDKYGMLPSDLGGFSLATLRHYIQENEMLGYRILTLWNIALLHKITEHMRGSIEEGKLEEFIMALQK